jgi:Ricin-type beta-trefoil lectin domain
MPRPRDVDYHSRSRNRSITSRNRILISFLISLLSVAGLLMGQGWAQAATFDSRYPNFTEPGRCMDDSDQAHLRMFTCNGLDYQLWHVTTNTDGTVTLRNAHTNRCLDASPEFSTRTFNCNGLNYQRWHRSFPTLNGRTYVSWFNWFYYKTYGTVAWLNDCCPAGIVTAATGGDPPTDKRAWWVA